MTLSPPSALFAGGLTTAFVVLIAAALAAATANVTSIASSDVTQDLYVMGLFPFSGSWSGGESLEAAARLGLDQINALQVVPGYRIHLLRWDSQCDPGIGIKGLFEMIYRPPIKIIVLGDGCSAVSEATARASHLWNLVQLSYGSSSPVLSQKALFPRFARVTAPESVSNPAKVKFFKHFKWKRISTLHETEEVFAKTTEDLIDRLKVEGFTVARSEIFRDNPKVQLQNLKDNDCRIIVGSFYENSARKVMCEAYKLGLYGRRVVWVLTGWYDDRWWEVRDPSVDCSPLQLTQAAEGYFEFDLVRLNPEEEPSVSGWTPSDFRRNYYNYVNNRSLFGDHSASQAYDAVWALALALNAARQNLSDTGSSKRLEDFTYNDTEICSLIFSSLLNLSFVGLKGRMGFDSNGDGMGPVQVRRMQDGQECVYEGMYTGGAKKPVASYSRLSQGADELEWDSSNPIVWHGGVAPRDWTVRRVEYEELDLALYATMCVLASLGILLAGAFLAFNVLLRDVKSASKYLLETPSARDIKTKHYGQRAFRLVRMSSPRINNVILTGCTLCYASIFIQDAVASYSYLGCEVKTFLLALGICLALGALFAKTWRVHLIFTNTRRQKKTISDTHLFGVIGVLVLTNLAVLVTWWVVDPRDVGVTYVVKSLEEDAAGEVEVWRCERPCRSKHQLYFLGTLYAIHALVLLFGTFLAYETRNVHYPELNDSKYIGMCVYNVALLSVPAVVLGVAMDPAINLKYAIGSSLVLIGTTVTQCLIFVPKVTLYRHNRVHGMDETLEHSSSRGTDFMTRAGQSSTSNVKTTLALPQNGLKVRIS